MRTKCEWCGVENHKTETQFEDALISKRFLFDFVNSYAMLVYVGIVKQHMMSNDFLGDRCENESCLVDLTVSKPSIMRY